MRVTFPWQAIGDTMPQTLLDFPEPVRCRTFDGHATFVAPTNMLRRTTHFLLRVRARRSAPRELHWTCRPGDTPCGRYGRPIQLRPRRRGLSDRMVQSPHARSPEWVRKTSLRSPLRFDEAFLRECCPTRSPRDTGTERASDDSRCFPVGGSPRVCVPGRPARSHTWELSTSLRHLLVLVVVAILATCFAWLTASDTCRPHPSSHKALTLDPRGLVAGVESGAEKRQPQFSSLMGEFCRAAPRLTKIDGPAGEATDRCDVYRTMPGSCRVLRVPSRWQIAERMDFDVREASCD